MKKNIIIAFLFLIFLCFFINQLVFAKNDKKWTKINGYTYIDKSSITKNGDLVSAWFKFYKSSQHELLYKKINKTNVRYEMIKYEVDCENNAIEIKHFKYFGRNNVLLKDEPNNYGVGCSCSGLIDGEIICKAICKN